MLDGAVGVEDFLVGLERPKRRIRGNKFQKLRQRSGEADLVLDLFHFAPETCDLAEADLVNLVRRQIGRGHLLHQAPIRLGSARQGTEAGGHTGRISTLLRDSCL